MICLFPMLIRWWVRKPSYEPNISNHCRSKGRGCGSSKACISPPVIYSWPFQGGTSDVVPQCFMLSWPCAYGPHCRSRRGEFGSSKNMFKPPPLPSNLLLTVPVRYFCCGTSVLHVVMSVCISSFNNIATGIVIKQLPIMLLVDFFLWFK